jgi:hypothetical protein
MVFISCSTVQSTGATWSLRVVGYLERAYYISVLSMQNDNMLIKLSVSMAPPFKSNLSRQILFNGGGVKACGLHGLPIYGTICRGVYTVLKPSRRIEKVPCRKS